MALWLIGVGISHLLRGISASLLSAQMQNVMTDAAKNVLSLQLHVVTHLCTCWCLAGQQYQCSNALVVLVVNALIVLVVKCALAGAWHDRHSGSSSCYSTTMLVAQQNLLRATNPLQVSQVLPIRHPPMHSLHAHLQSQHSLAEPECPDICSSVALVTQATDEVACRRLVLTRSPIR